VSLIELLRDKSPRRSVARESKEMARETVIADGMAVRGRTAVADPMLRGIVKDDCGIAVLVMAATVHGRRQGHPGHEKNQGLGDRKTPE
jgi:hypothetical protein